MPHSDNNMKKQGIIQLVIGLIMVCASTANTHAYNATHFTDNSKLASGHWVKVAVPESGIYEITYDELTEMGFTSPESVSIFGYGGVEMSYSLDGSQPDDLSVIPVLRSNDKLIFYGKGPETFTLVNPLTEPYFTRELNGYSSYGFYFLTDSQTQDDTIPVLPPSDNVGSTPITSSFDYFWHERELCSLSFSGRQLLGEDIGVNKAVFEYSMPGISSADIVVHTEVGAKVSATSYIETYINSGSEHKDVGYTLASSTITTPGELVLYNIAKPHKKVTLADPQPSGTVEVGIYSPTGVINSAKLDNVIITYEHLNVIDENNDNQVRMTFVTPSNSDRVVLPHASATTMVWNIDNVLRPKAMTMLPWETDDLSFAPASQGRYAQYVAFDPALTLKKVAQVEQIPNQNLHSMEPPTMLIVTNNLFIDQAQRIARMHEQVDGIHVAVVDQEQVFNEFSSGRRDPMAVRLLCKMFYDRDTNQDKFQHLLMFGGGTFDNRNLLKTHGFSVVNFEMPESHAESKAYTTDDFFGYLKDGDKGTGDSIARANHVLRLGIGRMTCKNEDEAKTLVDKLVKQYANPDYGTWRNNVMITCDDYDEGMHIFQAEGITEIIQNDLASQLQVNKVFCPMYPRALDEEQKPADRRTASEGKRHWTELSQRGQYFASYIGHAGPTGFTKVANMWTMTDVQNTSFEHLPIWSTACCDVARYDSDQRGVADMMFHKPDGGALAMLTSSRQVYANSNDLLNRAFVKALFPYNSTGQQTTLGGAYRQAKNSFTSTNTNKLTFLLLGDPAMAVDYPKPLVKITKVNGKSVDSESTINIYPSQVVEVEAQAMTPDGSAIDNAFTGEAYVSLYGPSRLYKNVTAKNSLTGLEETKSIYHERDLLGEVKGRMENGVFKGVVVVPRYLRNFAVNGMLRIYAHQEGTRNMINGETDKVHFMPLNGEQDPGDNEPPVIEEMFFNEENNTSDGTIVPSDATLYIKATDNHGLSTHFSNSIGSALSLVLDNGKNSFYNAHSYATCQDEGKTLLLAYPIAGMSDGLHTITFTVYDAAGNAAKRTLSFVVTQNHDAKLTVDDILKARGEQVSFDFSSTLTSSPTVDVKVTDALGKLVWSTQTSTFPVAWDLKDSEGENVPAGSYRFFATYQDGVNFGGTAIGRMIVIEPINTNE